jgi:hypothetical protein
LLAERSQHFATAESPASSVLPRGRTAVGERNDDGLVYRLRVTRFVRDGGGWRPEATMGPFDPGG